MKDEKVQLSDGTILYSPRSLGAWLAAQGLPVQHWGMGSTKSVAHLWEELQSGESELQVEPLVRHTRVVVVWVRRGPHCLIERSQEWDDGRMRLRNGPPSDKLLRGESWREGALRCLWEELALPPAAVTLHEGPTRERRIDRVSTSYPGLSCRYLSRHLSATVDGLPDGPFRTAEQEPAPSDPVRFHDWVWQRCDEARSPV